MDHLCYLCFVFVILSRPFSAALWSPDGKGLTSWLLFVIFNCAFVTFPCGILGQMWYMIYRFLIFAVFLTLNTFVYLCRCTRMCVLYVCTMCEGCPVNA